MNRGITLFCMVAAGFAQPGKVSAEVPLLSPGDFIIAIDLDGFASSSSYPGPEGPANIVDGNPATKYLNFAGPNSGFIVAPAIPGTVLQSFRITTANDFVARDPAAFELFGTNDPIISTDNSAGTAEEWHLIASGPLSLPDERMMPGPVVAVSNATAYDSYRMMFPQLKTGLMMQIADVEFYQSPDGSGPSFLAPGDSVLAVHLGPTSRYPALEGPTLAIDGNVGTKYLNFGKENSGFIVTPSIGPTIVSGFQMTTANDDLSRDPAGWALYGTNDSIISTDNSDGMSEDWVLIDSGTVALPNDRLAAGPMVAVSGGDTFYSSYRFVVTEVKNPADADSMQFAEIQFHGRVIPEPSGVMLLAGGGVLLLGLRRGRTRRRFLP